MKKSEKHTLEEMGKNRISVSFFFDDFQKIETLAKQRRISLSSLIREIIHEYLNQKTKGEET